MWKETIHFSKDPYPPEVLFSDDELQVQGSQTWDTLRQIRIQRLILSPGFLGMDIPVWNGKQHRLLTRSTRPGVLWQLTAVDDKGPIGHGDYGGTSRDAHSMKALVHELHRCLNAGADVTVLWDDSRERKKVMGKAYDSKRKPDTAQIAARRKEELTKIGEKLEKGLLDLFQSDNYKKYLDVLAKFPMYSFNNVMLIKIQRPDASLCQSYKAWQSIGRHVKKGEKGIRILAPAPGKTHKMVEKTDSAGKPVIGPDGQTVKERVEVSFIRFVPVSTFDISQTEGEPLPQIGVDELKGGVADYSLMMQALKQASPAPITFDAMKDSEAKGSYSPITNTITIREHMDEVQNIKTAIHEMAHAALHNLSELSKRKEEGTFPDRGTKEVEAESVAYTVCQHYGINTSDYSFAYIAGWSAKDDISTLKSSLHIIQKASSAMIDAIDKNMDAIRKERNRLEPKQREPEDLTKPNTLPEPELPTLLTPAPEISR